MKVLCLHGNGTNSNIMQLQTTPLRHELEDDHEYEFVEAAVEVPMSEGIEALSSPSSSFYAFYNPQDLSTLRRSINQLDDYVSAEGPFDAVMGFSGGAVLAAMYLVEQQRQQDRSGGKAKDPIKCGIFLSSASCRAEASLLAADAKENSASLIRIPTVHIWGSNDVTAPTGGEDLSRLCNPAQRLVLVRDGGHEVPRGSYLIESVHLIRRALHLAEVSQGGLIW